MDFEPTPDEEAVRESARRLVVETLPGLSADGAEFVRGAHAALARSGLIEARTTTVGAALAVIELAVGSASLGAVMASAWLLRGVLGDGDGGGVVGCLALSDRQALDTEGDDGSLSFLGVPCAAVATRVLLGTRTPSGGTLASLDASASGFCRAAPSAGFCLNRSASADIVVPTALLSAGTIHAEGERGAVAIEALLAARTILTGAVAVGVGKRVMVRAAAHARAATPRPSQLLEFALSDVATDLDAATVAVLSAAWLRDSGAPHRIESAGARLFAARAATRIAHGAIEVCGGDDPDGELRRAYFDARALELFDGSLGPQVNIIASTLLEER